MLFDNRGAAVRAVREGLAVDPKDAHLRKLYKELGVRRQQVLSFLPRAHPVNRFLGRLRHWLRGGAHGVRARPLSLRCHRPASRLTNHAVSLRGEETVPGWSRQPRLARDPEPRSFNDKETAMKRSLTIKLCACGLLFAFGLLGAAGAAFGQTTELDSALKPYAKTSGVSGNLKSIGSDTLNNLMTLWAGRLQEADYPNVQIEIEGKGSSTAPPALIAGTAQFGPMSREMKAGRSTPSRRSSATSRRRSQPPSTRSRSTSTRTTRCKCLTLQQVDAIFSKTRKGGGKRPRHVGRPRPHRRVGGQAHQPLRPQLRLGHLRLLQGARALQGRLTRTA